MISQSNIFPERDVAGPRDRLFDVLSVLGSILLVLWLWILFGFQPPAGDAQGYLQAILWKWGLVEFPWYEQLTFYAVMTSGPNLFLGPLLLLFKTHWFFWIGSSLLAATAVACVFLFRSVLRRVLSAPIAALGLLLVCWHPYLSQMHYFWKDEWLYITMLIFGLFQLSQFLDDLQPVHALGAGVSLFFSYLMRSQALLAFPIGIAAIAARYLAARWIKQSAAVGRKLFMGFLLFIIPPLLLSLPFRWQNHRCYGSWALNKVNGLCSGLYLQVVPAFSPDNGPHSRQLWIWGKEYLADPSRFREMTGSIPANYAKLFSNGAGELVHGDGHLYFMTPKVVSYLFLRDMIKADDFAAAVAREAYVAQWRLLVEHLYKRGRFYFTGVGQNPIEWDPGFSDDVVAMRKDPFRLRLKDGSEVAFVPLGGLYFSHPALYQSYRKARLMFANLMTYVKKFTFVSIPLLLWVYAKRGPMRFSFLSLLVAVHLATGLALAVIITYFYHYSAPLEIFPIMYLMLWLDLLYRWSKPFFR